MSWESTATALIEALNRHSTALETFVKQTAKAGGGAASAETEAPKKKAAAAETTAAPKKKTAAWTEEKIAAKWTGFLKSGSEEDQGDRIKTVKKINAHFEVPKMTSADPSIWPEAVKVLDRVIAGEDVDDILAELSGDEGEDEDESGSIV